MEFSSKVQLFSVVVDEADDETLDNVIEDVIDDEILLEIFKLLLILEFELLLCKLEPGVLETGLLETEALETELFDALLADDVELPHKLPVTC
jgi:hypothetical protein